MYYHNIYILVVYTLYIHLTNKKGETNGEEINTYK